MSEKSNEEKPTHWLKVREDVEPIGFTASDSSNKGDAQVLQAAMGAPKWARGDTLTNAELRERIEPWLTALFQSEHLSLLAGSGLTHAVHMMAVDDIAVGMNAKIGLKFEEITQDKNAQLDKTAVPNEQSVSDDASPSDGASTPNENSPLHDLFNHAVQQSAKNAKRNTENVEDEIRVANELLRGLQILKRETEKESLSAILKEFFRTFATSILESEQAIAKGKSKAFNTLVTFLMSFASRTGTRDRLHIFTTNYDRVIEMGAELAGLHLLDRFVGNLSPIFRSSRLSLDLHYNPPGIRGEPRYLEGVARFTKLHGSIDWVQSGRDIRRMGLPFGAADVSPYLKAPGLDNASVHDLMIYPNAAKDRETSEYPYVDLFRDFAAAACRPNHTLVTYGYSFGDEHINRIIEDMLTIPSTHLVVISYDDGLGRIMETYNRLGRSSQITLLIGPLLADLNILTSHFLPKPSIDKSSYRMHELLKQRMGAKPRVNDTDKQDSNENNEAP